MKFYKKLHTYYCGIDLHAKTIQPYQEDVVVTVECMFCWYWLADLCREHGIAFVLGHAFYIKAIHGGKARMTGLISQR